MRNWIALVLVVGTVLLFVPRPALAHCDNVNGPVVAAARAALESGKVELIAPYVQAEAEAELTAAFQQAVQVRQAGGAAQELADRYFFETAVRLHRQGEGAAYTGLKYEDDFGPALHAAEEALATGKTHAVEAILTGAVRAGLEERYHALLAAREAAAEAGTVAANRERVEAELGFELYVHELYLAATGAGGHGEEGAGLVPLRATVEAAGGQVEWEEATQTAIARMGEKELRVRPGHGGAVLRDGVTFVPAALLEILH